jgi:septum formation inhibitor-activating ATPase MinD
MKAEEILDYKETPQTISLREGLHHYRRGTCDSKMIQNHVVGLIEVLVKSQLQERDNAFQEKLKDIIKEIQERRPDIIKDKYFAGLDDGFEVSTMILDKHINLTPKQDPKQS